MKEFVQNMNKEILSNIEWRLKNEGMEDSYKIMNILNDKLNESFEELDQLINHFKIKMINNTSHSCEYLPKQLLYEFADSLIRLTALKQKLSSDLETVSSENDIAIITKSYNFKWAKYTEEII